MIIKIWSNHKAYPNLGNFKASLRSSKTRDHSGRPRGPVESSILDIWETERRRICQWSWWCQTDCGDHGAFCTGTNPQYQGHIGPPPISAYWKNKNSHLTKFQVKLHLSMYPKVLKVPFVSTLNLCLNMSDTQKNTKIESDHYGLRKRSETAENTQILFLQIF